MTDSAATSQLEASNGSSSIVGRIVVGVDGSAQSIAALGWGLQEARLRRTSVHAVIGCADHPRWGYPASGAVYPTAYSPGMLPGGPVPMMAFPPPPDVPETMAAEVIAAAQHVLDEAVSRAVEHDPASGEHPVRVTSDAVSGHAAAVLLDAVTESDLLVVGAPGHGAFVGALLGSVSNHVVSQAPCPVVVVRAREPTS